MTDVSPPPICDACGQKIRKLNPHRMDRQKVFMLQILAKAYVAGHPWVKVGHGNRVTIGDDWMIAPYRAEAHASRLKWFGLAEHGEHRSGLYRVTAKGIDFLCGRATVPALIYCKEGGVIEASAEQVRVEDVKRVVFDKAYWDAYPALQKPDESVRPTL